MKRVSAVLTAIAICVPIAVVPAAPAAAADTNRRDRAFVEVTGVPHPTPTVVTARPVATGDAATEIFVVLVR